MYICKICVYVYVWIYVCMCMYAYMYPYREIDMNVDRADVITNLCKIYKCIFQSWVGCDFFRYMNVLYGDAIAWDHLQCII